MELPEGFVYVRDANAEGVVRADLGALPLETWWADGAPLAAAKGRGGVVRARIGAVDAVLRTYRRGGMLRRALPDAFRSPERAVAELVALAELCAAGVPVVEPLAAIARRCGLLWELRLATVAVDGAAPLPAFVAEHPAWRRAAVRTAGEVVGRAFAAGLEHPDLHPDNLIARVDGDRVDVRLLDLDRARLVPELAGSTRDAMLVRMARYLLRHRDALPVLPSWSDFVRFLAGAGLDRDDRRATVTRLGPELARQASRRGLALHLPPQSRPA